MTNNEFPMTKEFLNPNDEGKSCAVVGIICAFVLRISSFSRAVIQMQNSECGALNRTTDD